MRPRDVLSLLLVLLAGGLVVLGLVARPDPRAASTPRQFFALEGGRPLSFRVPPEATRARLVTARIVEASEPPGDDLSWHLDLGWLDPFGALVERTTISEFSRVDWLPGTLGDPEVRTSVALLDEAAFVTDTRATYLPLDLLPDGGTLRIAAHGDARVLVRLFAEEQLPFGRMARVLDAPSRSETARAERALRVPDIALLVPWERWSLLSRMWRRLEPIDAGGARVRPLVADPPRAGGARAARRVRLEPGRSLAVNLAGPGRIRVSGPPAVHEVEVRCVADAEPCDVAVGPTDPVGLADAPDAIEVVRERGIGPASILLHHRGASAVDLVLTAPSGTPLFGEPPIADLQALYPGEALLDDTWLAPETHARSWPVAAEEPARFARAGAPDEEVRLTLRPMLDGPDDRRPRTVEVRGLGRGGRSVWSRELVLEAVPAPLDALDRGADAVPGWVGEPEHVWARYGDAEAIEVRAERPVLVRASTEGAPRGSAGIYALPRGGAVVRFAAEHATRWREWPVANEDALRAAGQWEVLRGIVRLEPVEGREPADDRRWASVPLGGGTEPWLFPRPEGSRAPKACAVRPGEEVPLVDPEADDWSEAVLWAGAGGLDAPWEVRLDGVRWRSGRLRQEVSVVRGLAASFEAIAFSGPPDAVLWWKASADASCPEARALRMLRPVASGERLKVAVPGAPRSRLLVFGGAARTASPLEVRIAASASPGLHTTSSLHRIVLAPDDQEAASLYDPGLRLPVLDSGGLRLGADLASEVVVEVVNRGSEPIWLRAVVEGEGGERPSRDRIRLVSREQASR